VHCGAGALLEASLCRLRAAAAELPHACEQAPAGVPDPQSAGLTAALRATHGSRNFLPYAASGLRLRETLQVANVAKDIIFDNVSRKKMQDGINKLADAVGVTLGPRGQPPAPALRQQVHLRSTLVPRSVVRADPKAA